MSGPSGRRLASSSRLLLLCLLAVSVIALSTISFIQASSLSDSSFTSTSSSSSFSSTPSTRPVRSYRLDRLSVEDDLALRASHQQRLQRYVDLHEQYSQASLAYHMTSLASLTNKDQCIRASTVKHLFFQTQSIQQGITRAFDRRPVFNISIGIASYIFDHWLPILLGSPSGTEQCTPDQTTSAPQLCLGGVARAFSVFSAIRSPTLTYRSVDGSKTYSIPTTIGFTPTASLLVTAGDYYTGAYWSQVSTVGKPLNAQFMRMLEFDAAGISTQELVTKDPSLSNLTVPFDRDGATFLARTAQFDLPPVSLIVSNMDYGTNQQAKDQFLPVQIYQFDNGELLAVFSYSDPLLYQGSRLLNFFPGVKLIDITTSPSIIQKQMSLLERQYGINKFALLSSFLDPSNSAAMVAYASQLVSGLYGIDMVIFDQRQLSGANTLPFTFTGPDGGTVVVATCQSYMQSACILNVGFDAYGNAVVVEGIPIELNQNIPEDPSLKQQVEKDFKSSVSDLIGSTLGNSAINEVASVFRPMRFNETATGNAVADSIRFAVGQPMAVVNSGGIRASFSIGPINFGGLLSLLPFSDFVSVVRIRGDDILLMLENSVQNSANADSSSPTFTTAGTGRFLQMSGIRVVWNPSLPAMSRVVSVSVQALYPQSTLYYPLQPDQYYSMAMASFVTTGSDGYNIVFDGTNRVQITSITSIRLEQAVSRYISSLNAQGLSLSTAIEGRIIRSSTAYPPVITSISPEFAAVSNSTSITITGSNLGWIPYALDKLTTGSVAIAPVSLPVSIVAGVLPCIGVEALAISYFPGMDATGWTYGPLASVSQVACIAQGTAAQGIARVTVDTRGLGLKYGNIGGYRSTRLNAKPWLNFTFLESLACPPSSSYPSASGGCTCRAGFYATVDPILRRKICAVCPAGTYSGNDDSFTCIKCTPGSYAGPGSTSCAPCPPNFFNNITGSSICAACPFGASTYSNIGSTSCRCEVPYVSSYSGSNLTCSNCPEGAECVSTPGVARARAGYWYDPSNTNRFLSCPINFCCETSTIRGCLATDANRCYANRYGFMCSLCNAGYSHITDHDCTKCKGFNGGAAAAFVAVSIIFVLLCVLENPSEDASLKLLIDYLQIFALIINPTLSVADVLALINMKPHQLVSLFNDCLYYMSPLHSLFFPVIPSVILFVVLMIIRFCWWLRHKCCCVSAEQRAVNQASYEANKWRFTHALWTIFMVCFVALVETAIRILDCRYQYDRYVVRLQPSIECFSGDHFPIAVIAVVVLVVLILVIPIWLITSLSTLNRITKRRPSEVLISIRQLKQLRAEAKSVLKESRKTKNDIEREALEDRIKEIDSAQMGIKALLASNLQREVKVVRTGHELVLWCYKRDKYFSEALFLLRRICMVVVVVLVPRETASMVIAWLVIFTLIVKARFPLFRKQSSSYFHDFCLGAIAFQCVFNLKVFTSDSNGKINWSNTTELIEGIITYIVACAPIATGIVLFGKETWKERIRKKSAEEGQQYQGMEFDGSGATPTSKSELEMSKKSRSRNNNNGMQPGQEMMPMMPLQPLPPFQPAPLQPISMQPPGGQSVMPMRNQPMYPPAANPSPNSTPGISPQSPSVAPIDPALMTVQPDRSPAVAPVAPASGNSAVTIHW